MRLDVTGQESEGPGGVHAGGHALRRSPVQGSGCCSVPQQIDADMSCMHLDVSSKRKQDLCVNTCK